jgi:NodT family efflux transporter outer membrane factor (OMF) lipoprotein
MTRRRLTRRFGLLTAMGSILCAGWLTGCATEPMATVQPVADMPDTFSGAGAEPLPDRWWEALEDPGLTTAIEEALGGSFTLRSAWDRLAQAEAVARREGATAWPDVDLSAGARRDRTERNSTTDYETTLSLGATISYEVDLWGRLQASRDAARFDVEAAEADVQAAAITLSASVATVWYQLAEATAQVDVLLRQLETNRKVYELINVQFKNGKTQAADVLRQRQLVQQTEGQLELALARAQVLRHQLAVLLGRPPTADVVSGGAWIGTGPVLIEVPELPATGLPIELLTRRPDLQSDYAAIEAADRRLASSIAEQYPKLSLSAGASTSAEEVRDLFDNWLANIAANLAYPLVDGGSRAAEVDRRRAQVSQAINDYGQTTLTALQEVEDALVSEAYQASYLTSIGEQLETAGRVIERTRDQYLNGQFDYIRVLDALTSYQSLERTHLTARRDVILERINLCRAIAGAWPMERPSPATAASTDEAERTETETTSLAQEVDA